jgi:Ca2+-transporting ATPase
LKPPQGAGNDYQKDLQFRKLNAVKDVIETKVLRGGHVCIVPNFDVVVGDVMLVDTGDKIVADGVMVDGHHLVRAGARARAAVLVGWRFVLGSSAGRMQPADCACACAALSLASATDVMSPHLPPSPPPCPQVVDEASLTGESDPIKKSPDEDPWCRSGTQVSEGSGRLLVVAVGPQSEWGKTMALVGQAGDEDTPLQEKLADMAAAIGKVGGGGGNSGT